MRGGPPERRAFNRGEWHYVNLPLFLTDAAWAELAGRLTVNVTMDPPTDATRDTQKMNVVQVIRFARKQLADTQAGPEARAVMLAWLFHDVGDIHQPLHSSALFSTRLFRDGDRGGNSIKTSQSGNLHTLWDQFPGSSDTYRGARNKAIADIANPELVALGTKAKALLDEKVWLDESHDLAKRLAYSAEVLDALRKMEATGANVEEIGLSETYLRAGGRESERRLVLAGYRRGAVLKQLAN